MDKNKEKKKVMNTKNYLSWLQYLYWVTYFITEELALEAKTCFIVVLLLSLRGICPQEEASIKS